MATLVESRKSFLPAIAASCTRVVTVRREGWNLVAMATPARHTRNCLGPVALALVGSGLRLPGVAFVGWFGPRGLASILFVLVVVEEGRLASGPLLEGIVLLTVFLSAMLHGASSKIDAALTMFSQFEIIETVRTGKVVMARGEKAT